MKTTARQMKLGGDTALWNFTLTAKLHNLCSDPAKSFLTGPKFYENQSLYLRVRDRKGGELPLFCTERRPDEPDWCESARAGMPERLYGHWGRPVIRCAFNNDRLIILSAFFDAGIDWIKSVSLDTKKVASIPVASLTGYSPRFYAIATGQRHKNGDYKLLELTQ